MALATVTEGSGKALIKHVPLYKQRWRVSEADLHKMSSLFGRGWWEMFARKIGFHEEVENIKNGYIGLHNWVYQLLLQWSSRYESKATYRIILKALSELNQINALHDVCKLLHAQSEPGRPLPSALERYSDALKSKYSEYKLKAIVDWPPPPAENIVKLAMIGDPKIDDKFIGDMTQGNVRSVLNTKTVIEPVDLFQRIESGGGKVILLEGAPGSGKSTMCWYICKQWGEGTLLQGFTHVLMIELRDKTIQAAKHLVQILPYFLGHDNRVAEDLIKKHGDNVLVILEGWNELPKNLRKESIFKDLVTKGGRSPLQNAVVLVSSRSNTTVDLQQYIALQVEALGFTPDQIKAYVEGCFESKGEPDRAQKLLAIINRNPKLRENCYLPLMLIIIVHLYDCSKTLPESFCAIIIELALSCLYRYCKENGILDLEDSMVSLDDVPSQLQPRVYELCELAYNATVNERYSFSNPQMDGLGLLQNVRSIAARGSSVTQYFLHSSLQELCAALHVSRQPVPK
ncbi:Protein NLRC3, partial [Geodia barretti]